MLESPHCTYLCIVCKEIIDARARLFHLSANALPRFRGLGLKKISRLLLGILGSENETNVSETRRDEIPIPPQCPLILETKRLFNLLPSTQSRAPLIASQGILSHLDVYEHKAPALPFSKETKENILGLDAISDEIL